MANKQHRLIGTGVFLVGLLGASIAAGWLQLTNPAAAIQIHRTESDIRIEVVDIIANPETVVATLAVEGVTAELFAVPAPTGLVGQVSSVGNIGAVEPTLTWGTDGTIDQIVVPAGFIGSLIIEYGRIAEPGESYAVTESDARCQAMYWQTPDESRPMLRTMGDSIRFHIFDAEGVGTLDINPIDIPADYRLIDIMAMSERTYLAEFVEVGSPLPLHSDCD